MHQPARPASKLRCRCRQLQRGPDCLNTYLRPCLCRLVKRRGRGAGCPAPSSQLGVPANRLGRDRFPRSAPLQQPKLGFAAHLKTLLNLSEPFVGPSHLRSSCATAWASQDGPDTWGANCRARLREAASAICCPVLRLMCRCKQVEGFSAAARPPAASAIVHLKFHVSGLKGQEIEAIVH